MRNSVLAVAAILTRVHSLTDGAGLVGNRHFDVKNVICLIVSHRFFTLCASVARIGVFLGAVFVARI